MKIAKVKIENFKGIAHWDIDFRDKLSGQPLDLIVLAGPNGCGKTSVLEAIISAKEGLGSYGEWRFSQEWIRKGADYAVVEIDWELSENERKDGEKYARSRTLFPKKEFKGKLDIKHGVIDGNRRLEKLLSSYSHSGETGIFEYIDSHRVLGKTSVSSADSVELNEERIKHNRLRIAHKNFDIVKQFLVSKDLEDAKKLKDEGIRVDSIIELKKTLDQFLYPKKFHIIKKIDELYKVFFDTGNGSLIDMDEFSSGEKEVLGIITTLFQINPNHSIILIDEPDLHLHAKWQIAFLNALQQIGEDNQFIVATHSLELLASLPSYHIFYLSPQDELSGKVS